MSEEMENTGRDRLSIAERIILVQDIWDSIAAEQGALDLSDAQKSELHKRLKEHLASPEDGNSWEQIRDRLSSR